MTAPLGVLTIGAGYFARFHHDAWQRHPETELVGIVDQDIARAKETGAPAFASLSDGLTTEPDIIDIATPPPSHGELIRAALDAAPRAIVCQKPFATSLEEGEALARDAEARGIPLIIHENFRFQPWFRMAKQRIECGALGELHQLTFRFRTGDGQGPEAYLDRQPYFQKMPRLLVHETAVHYIDTFRYLLGEIEGVYADLRHMNPAVLGEDAGHIIFSFKSGIRAVFDGNRHLDHASENTRLTFGEATIEGNAATLELRGDGALTQRAFGTTGFETVLPAKDWPGFAGDCVYALQAHVVEALRGRGCFENEAREYLKVRRVEEAIYLSHHEKRWVAT